MQERKSPMSPLAQARGRMLEEGRDKHLCKTLTRGGVGLRRKVFDPSSFDDRLQYARFLTQGRWCDGNLFECEAPFMSVPETVREKLLAHFLRIEIALPREFDLPAARRAPVGNVVSLRPDRLARRLGQEEAAERETAEGLEVAEARAAREPEVA